MNFWSKFSVKTLSAACFTAVCLAGSVQAGTEVNLSYNGAPDAGKNPVHAFAIDLQARVEEKTKGEITLKLFPNSMLGEEQDRMEQTISTPSLNVASFAGVTPIVPEVFVSSTPFLFEDFTSARAFFDKGEFWSGVKASMRERAGVEMLAVVEEGGFLAFTNNKKPISSPQDFDGLRFRAMDPGQVALYEGFGASGTPIPWTEVYQALKTGVADGQMNPPAYIILGSLYEVQTYLTLANIQYSPQFLVGNGAFIDGLDEATRAAFLEAIDESSAATRSANEAQVNDRIKYLEDKGMVVIQPSTEELAKFRDLGQPAYLDWLKEQGISEASIAQALNDAGASAQ
ncbi:TRAP transporter substrate-binding protein DctP [Shimia sediminis]|uniref:TRAP transporter substrate-binding protein DctP n=1 Tax=Shimia sediminis TaxID=2497945 RepID=UPI000F8DB2CE|nr:TRAP transporter substrate-binding protein DctP [Shimia sediminis]